MSTTITTNEMNNDGKSNTVPPRRTSSLMVGGVPLAATPKIAAVAVDGKEPNIPLSDYFEKNKNTSRKQRRKTIVKAAIINRNMKANVIRNEDRDDSVEYELPAALSAGGNTRSLVGGSFVPSSSSDDDDTASMSSTSLVGAGYTEGDSISTATSRSYMEYSEEDSSTNQEQNHHHQGKSRTHHPYLLNRQESESDFSDQSSSFMTTDNDAYFHMIHPPQSLLTGTAADSNIDSDSDSLASLTSEVNILSMVSSDTEIFEDEGDSSSAFEVDDLLFADDDSIDDDDDDDCWNSNHTPEKRSDIEWSHYNQARGRNVAQLLLAQARNKQDECRDSSRTLSTQSSGSPTPEQSKKIQHFIKHLRRKRLDKDYFVVDATAQHLSPIRRPCRNESDASDADSEHSSDGSLESWSDSLYDSADEGDIDDDGDDFLEMIEAPPPPSKEPDFPNALVHRATGEDIIEDLDLGPEALVALHELRKRLQETTTKDHFYDAFEEEAHFTIMGIYDVPDYQTQVQNAVARYRRNIFKASVSDDEYLHLMMTGSNDSSTAGESFKSSRIEM